MAIAADKDPIEFTKAILKGHPRHHGVLKFATEKAGWESELPQGKVEGVAVHEVFGGFIVKVADVSVSDDGK